MVQGKEYFVITTNVDGQFAKAGFDPDKVFEVQGDYGLMQCATACHPKRYSNESLVKQMVAEQQDCRIPSSLVPRCPVCGVNTASVTTPQPSSVFPLNGWQHPILT